MGQYNISVEDQFFFDNTAKGRGAMISADPCLLRLVGRGLWFLLFLIHEKKLFQKALRIHTKKFFRTNPQLAIF
jgi:hypothetical protein